MGIEALLPALEGCMDKVHISVHAHQRVAVDTYSWLHRGSYSCAKELCMNIPTTKPIEYCLERIRMLQKHKVIPLLVFDGNKLPEKAMTESAREARRTEARAKALQYLKDGNSSAAMRYFQQAVDITPDLAHKLMVCLKKLNIEFIVAPYEADPQLSYLCRIGHVSAVISEDSDLIAFGCPRVFFKMDKFGNGQEFNMKNLGLNRTLDLSDFTEEMLLQMCILCGCDYLDSIPGIGVKRAHAVLAKHRSYKEALRVLRLEGKVTVPLDYEIRFLKAQLTFKHQYVFDPSTQQLEHFSPLPDDFHATYSQWTYKLPAEEIPTDSGTAQPGTASLSELRFLGFRLAPEVAVGVATGELHPETLKPYSAASSSPPSLFFSQSAPSLPTSTAAASSPSTTSETIQAPLKRAPSFWPQARANRDQFLTAEELAAKAQSEAHLIRPIGSYFKKLDPPKEASPRRISQSVSSPAFNALLNFAYKSSSSSFPAPGPSSSSPVESSATRDASPPKSSADVPSPGDPVPNEMNHSPTADLCTDVDTVDTSAANMSPSDDISDLSSAPQDSPLSPSTTTEDPSTNQGDCHLETASASLPAIGRSVAGSENSCDGVSPKKQVDASVSRKHLSSSLHLSSAADGVKRLDAFRFGASNASSRSSTALSSPAPASKSFVPPAVTPPAGQKKRKTEAAKLSEQRRRQRQRWEQNSSAAAALAAGRYAYHSPLPQHSRLLSSSSGSADTMASASPGAVTPPESDLADDDDNSQRSMCAMDDFDDHGEPEGSPATVVRLDSQEDLAAPFETAATRSPQSVACADAPLIVSVPPVEEAPPVVLDPLARMRQRRQQQMLQR